MSVPLRRRRRGRTLRSYGLDLVDVLYVNLGRALGHSRYNQLTYSSLRDVQLWRTARGSRWDGWDDVPDYDDELLAEISPAGWGTDTVLVRLPDGRSSEVPTDELVAVLEGKEVYDSTICRLVEEAKGAGDGAGA